MSNLEYQPADAFKVDLSRPNGGVSWGFRLQGGVDFSTPLSIQVVQPNSVAEQCGLQAGDGIQSINSRPADQMSHDEAKQEIIRSGNNINLQIERGAVKVWKPHVTPMSELRPNELRTIQTATGDTIQPCQKTSLAINKPPDESSSIGSAHNRSAQPFGSKAVPNVVHAQFNSPMGLYSADNIAETYTAQTEGLNTHLQKFDVSEHPVGTKLTPTMQAVQSEGQSARYKEFGPNEEIEYSGYTNPHVQSRSFRLLQDDLSREEIESAAKPTGFRSVAAPTTNTAAVAEQKEKMEHMRCGGCDMLVTGVFVRVKGTAYHADCFKCKSCNRGLKQIGYFMVDGNLYCETHARQKAQPPNPDMVAVPVYR